MIDKRSVYRLALEYNNKSSKSHQAKCHFTSSGQVNLILNGTMHTAISLPEAHKLLKTAIAEEPRIRRGRGYIGKRMSVNAQIAHNNGQKPKSYFTRKVLKELGFTYPVGFFRWLIDSHYLMPADKHHTSAAKNYTNFYHISSVEYLVRSCNLDLLYDLYTEAITKHEAKKLRGIKYVRIRVPKSLLGSQGGAIVMECIWCDHVFFFSSKLCFSAADQRIQILGEYEELPSDFKNGYLKNLENNLIKRKTKTFLKYVKS